MSRAVPEWIGPTDDAPVPPRVRLRAFERAHGRCHLCTRKIGAGEYWECDHVAALCNGGANRESNLAPACRNCCKRKTARDVAEKAVGYRKRAKHLGIAPKRARPMMGSRASGWKKRINGQTERRT